MMVFALLGIAIGIVASVFALFGSFLLLQFLVLSIYVAITLITWKIVIIAAVS